MLDFLNSQFLEFGQDNLAEIRWLEIDFLAGSRGNLEVLEGRSEANEELDAGDACKLFIKELQ